MTELLSLGLVGVGLIGGTLGVRAITSAGWRRNLTCYELQFPRDIEAEDVAAFVAQLAGLTSSWWRRPLVSRAVVFEVVATQNGIDHRLVLSRSDAALVLGALRAAMPGVRTTEPALYQIPELTAAKELRLSDNRRMLDVANAERVTAAMLSSMQPLRTGETIVVSWAVMPVGPRRRSTTAKPRGRSSVLNALWYGAVGLHASEAEKVVAQKQSSSLFVAAGRVGVKAAGHLRARGLLAQVLGTLHVANGPGVRLRPRWSSTRIVARNLRDRRLPIVTFPAVLTAAELAALIAYPTKGISLPGLRPSGCRSLAPAADIPQHGRVLAQATFAGAERPIAISTVESLRHLHVIGPTGVGKSTLLLGLITQDMIAGHGVVVIEPAGDLVRDVLDRVPAHRLADVVVLDPADDEHPIGLNVLAANAADYELVSEQIVAIFNQIFKANWGPRSDDILRSTLLTLTQTAGMTLCDVPLLLSDPGLRRRLVGRLDDPILTQFWAWYEALGESERAQVIAPLSNKLRSFLGRRRLRNMLGQSFPRFDLESALAARRIILIPTNKGSLGEEAAALFGSLVVAQLWQCVMRRASLANDQRPTTFAYIDEFQDYVRLPQSIPDVLAQARKLKLGLTLAHQNLAQLPSGAREAVLANARSRVVFQSGADDARVLARDFNPYLEAADLQGLAAYEVVMSISAGGRVAPPVTGVTAPAPEATGLRGAALAQARQQYGRPRAEIEAEIRQRFEGRPVGGAIGRREVAP